MRSECTGTEEFKMEYTDTLVPIAFVKNSREMVEM
jgi:hypothetical protein